MRVRALVVAFVVANCSVVGTTRAELPKPPSTLPPVSELTLPVSTRTTTIRRGEDLQAALDAARGGDVLQLEAGATFTGPFTLPPKPGSEWIVVRSSAPDSALPPPNSRIDPSYASAMPKLVSSKNQVVLAAPGAHHYRLVGIEIAPASGTFLYNVVSLGSGQERTSEELPHDIIVDRCYVHGDPTRGSRRGVALNGARMWVVNSYLADFKEADGDSQAVEGWNGTGPFQIVNNYLEAAGENVMFGGADPAIPNLVPSDIEIRRNYFFKPYSWKVGDLSYAGMRWSVKNLLEFKNAQRVLVEGNELTHNWAAMQQGYAVLFTPRNQSGSAPWSVVSDITFAGNLIHDVAQGFSVTGRDDAHPSQRTSRILIKNNLLYSVTGSSDGPGMLFLIQAGVVDLQVDHNTMLQNGNLVFVAGAPNTGFVFQNNISSHNDYGVTGGSGIGQPTLDQFFPGATFLKNAIIANPGYPYPPSNYFPASVSAVGFTDVTRNNYRLTSSSPYRALAADGKDLGADIDALDRALGVAPAQAPGRSGG